MTGLLMVISGEPDSSLELVIIVIMMKNITYITKMAVWCDTVEVSINSS